MSMRLLRDVAADVPEVAEPFLADRVHVDRDALRPRGASIVARASLIRFALNAPASPRFAVSRMTAARFTCAGWRSSGNRSASSGEYRLAITSRSACAYGRAADTRSCARFIFDVATISIVRVILRVFSTDLMRPLSSRPLAICHLMGEATRIAVSA